MKMFFSIFPKHAKVMHMRITTFCIVTIAAVTLSSSVQAQTSTKVLNFSGGTGFSGTLDGSITATVKSQTDDASQQTGAVIDITDLDIDFIRGGGFLNFFPNGDSRNNTASAAINIANSVVGIELNNTAFSSTVSGSLNVTAGDALQNGVVGALDGGIPGSDGAWDDPGKTGILNGAVVNSVSVTTDSGISASAAVTGGLAASLINDVTIPDVVTGILGLDLRLKNSSSITVDFDSVQNITLNSVTISTSQPIGLNTPVSNFVEGTHPASPSQLDLSVSGAALATTTISGILSADLTGTISANLDLAADLSIIGIGFTVDFDDVVNGPLSEPGITLLSLNEAISLPNVDLPFLVTLFHEPTADVDFDDISALLQSGTLGLSVPFSITEEVVLSIPNVGFALGSDSGLSGIAGSFPVSAAGQSGTVELEHLAASLGGQVVLDLDADLLLSANLLATAFQSAAINVVPEPTSGIFLACAIFGAATRRRRS